MSGFDWRHNSRLMHLLSPACCTYLNKLLTALPSLPKKRRPPLCTTAGLDPPGTSTSVPEGKLDPLNIDEPNNVTFYSYKRKKMRNYNQHVLLRRSKNDLTLEVLKCFLLCRKQLLEGMWTCDQKSCFTQK